MLWGSTAESHVLFSKDFFLPNCVYMRFTHSNNMQPKFYIGSASHHAPLDREYSRSRKYLQLTHRRLVQAELALRHWREHQNLYVWAPIHLFYMQDYRSLELALIQEWQPRLNYPFICQFFHPKKSLLKRPAMNTNAQFGLATLWRRARHRFTPQIVKNILTSDRFQTRLQLWHLIHDLGSNTKARFETTKFLRSNEGGITLCYALCRLSTNIQEPFRTIALQAIDNTIAWWKGEPARRASALRAPWTLSPDLANSLRSFLRQWHLRVLAHRVPCHVPSFKTIFIKRASVDILCNHKQQWNHGPPPHHQYVAVEDGRNTKKRFWTPTRLTGSCLDPNKVFPSKREFLQSLQGSIQRWCKDTGLPCIPRSQIADLGQTLWSTHTSNITQQITRISIQSLESHFQGAVFHCEDTHASSLRIFCPCLYHQAVDNTFLGPAVFGTVDQHPKEMVSVLVSNLGDKFGGCYPWSLEKAVNPLRATS